MDSITSLTKTDALGSAWHSILSKPIGSMPTSDVRPDLGTRPEQIRGGAALVVAAAHAWQVFLYPLDKDAIVFNVLGGAAMWAVATFFLLSGALIAMSIRKRIHRGEGGFNLWHYCDARVRRIFPPLLVATFITVACVVAIQAFDLYGAENYWMPGDEAVSRDSAHMEWQHIVSTVTLTYRLIPGTEALFFNGPLWSLVYEFWFYIVAGLAAAAAINRSWVACTGALALVFTMLFVSNASPSFGSLGIVWGMGFAAGWWWSHVTRIDRRFVFLACGVFVFTALATYWDNFLSLLVSSYDTAFYILISAAILCAMILYLRYGGEGPMSRFMAYAGGFSYTLYLVHFPLLMFSLSLFRPSVLQFGLAGHAALGMASLVATIFVAERISLVVERGYRGKLAQMAAHPCCRRH